LADPADYRTRRNGYPIGGSSLELRGWRSIREHHAIVIELELACYSGIYGTSTSFGKRPSPSNRGGHPV